MSSSTPLPKVSAVDGGIVVSRMLDGDGTIGFDATHKLYVGLIAAGARRGRLILLQICRIKPAQTEKISANRLRVS